MSRSNGIRPIHDLTVASSSSSCVLHLLDRNGVSCAVLWFASSRIASPPRILPGRQHLTADCANDVFQAELVCVGVISLRAGELAQADRHHLEQPALDLSGEIGVPLHPVNQHDAIAFESHAVHERLDAVCRLAEGYDFQLADDRTAHRCSSIP